MSMNLHCDEMDLWQTPTYVSKMCMSYGDNGEPDGGMEGVRKRYLYWVESHTNGVWKDPEEYEWVKERVANHVAKVMSMKYPTFWIS